MKIILRDRFPRYSEKSEYEIIVNIIDPDSSNVDDNNSEKDNSYASGLKEIRVEFKIMRVSQIGVVTVKIDHKIPGLIQKINNDTFDALALMPDKNVTMPWKILNKNPDTIEIKLNITEPVSNT